MEYIFRFIEYINESNLFSIAMLLFIIYYLVKLYGNREEDEAYLGWKILGFYFLGGFNFNVKINWFVVVMPLGFCIYYFGMKNKERPNSLIKNKAVVFGVILLYLGIVNGMIYEKIEYRNRTIIIEDINLKNIGNDYILIKGKLGLDYAIIENLDLSFDNNGKIEYLQYTVKDGKKTCNILYEDDSYKISVTSNHSDDLGYFDGNRGDYEVEHILDMIINGDFNRYENAYSYRMTYQGHKKDYDGYEIYNQGYGGYKSALFYEINHNDYSIKKMDNVVGATYASAIQYNVLLNPNNSSNESYKSEVYLINYSELKNTTSYESIVIEKMDSGKSVVIDNQDDLRAIYKRTREEPYSWAPVQDLNIDFEPDAFVKYSDGTKIGFCKDRPFARKDEDGVSVWYIVPSDLYTFIINKYFDFSI